MAEIYGVELADLPEEYYATGAVMMIRGIDVTDGQPFMALRVTDHMPLHEIVGLAWTLYEDATSQTKQCLAEGMDD